MAKHPVRRRRAAVPHDRARVPLAALRADGRGARPRSARVRRLRARVRRAGRRRCARRRATAACAMKRFVVVVLASLVLAPGRSGDADGQLHARAAPRARTDGSRATSRFTGWSRSQDERDVEHRLPSGRADHDRRDRRRDTCPVDYSAEARRQATATTEDRQDGTDRRLGRAPARAPDADGWYNHPVAVRVQRAGRNVRARGLLRPRPTAAATALPRRVSGTCTDVAGNTSAPASVGLKYDATPPTVSPSRRPASGRQRAGTGSPSRSALPGTDVDVRDRGLHCADPLRRPGSVRQQRLSGRAATRPETQPRPARAFQYDATAPALAKTEAKVDKGVARIGWERAGDVVEVELLRSPGHQRREVDDRLQRQRRCVRRQDGESRHPLPLRDQRRRPGGQRHDEGRHGRCSRGQEHGPPRARHGLRREGAAAAPLEGGQGRDLLQRPALPERRQGAEHVARSPRARLAKTWTYARQAAAARARATTAGTSGARAARARSPSTGKCSARARSPSSADSYSKARPRRESSWSA